MKIFGGPIDQYGMGMAGELKKRIGIESKLLAVMAEAYLAGGLGVKTEDLCLITPAYSQRFGEWRKKDILITKRKNEGRTFTYYLKTDPEMIDWDEFKLIYRVEVPIRRPGRRIKQDENQMTINF